MLARALANRSNTFGNFRLSATTSFWLGSLSRRITAAMYPHQKLLLQEAQKETQLVLRTRFQTQLAHSKRFWFSVANPHLPKHQWWPEFRHHRGENDIGKQRNSDHYCNLHLYEPQILKGFQTSPVSEMQGNVNCKSWGSKRFNEPFLGICWSDHPLQMKNETPAPVFQSKLVSFRIMPIIDQRLWRSIIRVWDAAEKQNGPTIAFSTSSSVCAATPRSQRGIHSTFQPAGFSQLSGWWRKSAAWCCWWISLWRLHCCNKSWHISWVVSVTAEVLSATQRLHHCQSSCQKHGTHIALQAISDLLSCHWHSKEPQHYAWSWPRNKMEHSVQVLCQLS